MKVRGTPLMVFTILLTVSFADGRSGDATRALRSAACPGMGQLADGQVLKGMCFLTGEVALISASFAQFSKADAYSRRTEYLQVEYRLAESYEEKRRRDRQWRKSHETSGRAKTRGMVLAGLAGVWWTLNIADALLLPPDRKRDQEQTRRCVPSLRLSCGGEVVEAACLLQF